MMQSGWLTDLRAKYTPEVQLQLTGPGGRCYELDVAVWLLPQKGARAWWNLNHLHGVMGLEGSRGMASRWVLAGWHAWQGYCGKLGLDLVHLKDCIPWCRGGQAQRELFPQPVVEEALRVLQHKRCSTHLLVALLCRWSKDEPKAAFKAEKDRVAARLLLEAMLDSVAGVGRDLKVVVYMDKPEWEPPRRPRGGHAVVLHVTARKARLSEVLHNFDRYMKDSRASLASSLPELREEAPLARFLSALASSVGFLPLFKQLVWQLGTSIDMVMSRRAEKEGRVAGISARSARSFERELSKYVAANQRHFAEQRDLCICLDGGRIGQKQVVAGVLTDACGTGFVYPPQVQRRGPWGSGGARRVLAN